MDTRAIIFDFDGLILETESASLSCLTELFRSHGVELDTAVWTQIIGGTAGRFDIYQHLEELTGLALDREAVRREVRARQFDLLAELHPQPGVLDYLRDGKALGLKLGVASSSSREWVVGNLERLGLLHYFDGLRTRTDVTGTKPDSELYLASLACLGVDATEAIALEDSPNGVTAARGAGIFCVAVPNALTRDLPLDHADLRLESLADMPLAKLLTTRHLLHLGQTPI